MKARGVSFGIDHPRFGVVHATMAGERAAVVICAGSSPDSPAAQFKADPRYPNEDAALVLDDGVRCLLAVADSHFGHAASHALIGGLSQIEVVPPDVEALARQLDALDAPVADIDDRSASTLVVGVLDRSSGRGFGLSIGDSTLAVVGRKRLPIARNRHNRAYVHPGRDARLSRRAEPFRFSASPGMLVMAFTDGIDECHYRQPDTSLRPGHLAEIFARTGPEPLSYARALVDAALAGVAPYPGGEDNIGLVVVAA